MTEILKTLETQLGNICHQLHFHQHQYWLDAPGTLEERAQRALKVAREALHDLREAMTQATHTPGPWTLQDRRGNSHYANASVGSYERVMQHCFYISGPNSSGHFVADVIVSSSDEGTANAQLIAAAPDLLAVVEAFLRAPSIGGGVGSAKLEVQCYHIRAAWEAFSKATGEPSQYPRETEPCH